VGAPLFAHFAKSGYDAAACSILAFSARLGTTDRSLGLAGPLQSSGLTEFAQKEESTEAVGAVDPLCSSPRFSSRLLHHDLVAARVQRTLHAHSLAFELGYFGLVVDVIGLARVIFQHVLVALLYDSSRKRLAVGCRR